jgi:hypothetical protein
MSEPTPPRSDWTSPPVILGMLGMALGIGGSYAAFDSRITRVETRVERLATIESKLDQLLIVQRVR